MSAAAVLMCVTHARADEMDLALSRLRIPTGSPDCPSEINPSTGVETRNYCPDLDAWQRIVSEAGGAAISPMLTPARTTGYRGFRLTTDTWLTGISNDEEYWQVGTEGDEAAGLEGQNRFADSLLTWTRVSAKKGLPFGFEIGTSLSHAWNTSLWAWGVETKWAPVEGFRTGLGVLPDLAIRGAVQAVTGDDEYSLVIPSVDVILSKPFVLGGQLTLSPYVSAQAAWIIAESELVDLSPGVSAFEACEPLPGVTPPSCTQADGSEAQYEDHVVFPSFNAMRWRMAAGAELRFRVLVLTTSFTFDVMAPGDADSKFISDMDAPSDLPRQWTYSVGAGMAY